MIEQQKPTAANAEETDKPTRSEGRSGHDRGEARLTRDIQIKIGQQLRAMYADVVDQGVPDRFVELLTQLDRNGQHKKDEA
jgi:hypothetical protein